MLEKKLVHAFMVVLLACTATNTATACGKAIDVADFLAENLQKIDTALAQKTLTVSQRNAAAGRRADIRQMLEKGAQMRRQDPKGPMGREGIALQFDAERLAEKAMAELGLRRRLLFHC